MGATEKLKEQTGLSKKQPTMRELLESLKPQVKIALPRHLTAERMIRLAITCINTNNALQSCTPTSIMASIMLASQLGLEPGVMGQCYLVPYKGTCTLIPGWLGLMDLVNRSGKAHRSLASGQGLETPQQKQQGRGKALQFQASRDVCSQTSAPASAQVRAPVD